ncbi:MAG: hypothetical protein Q9217_000972 [Psora testacea]
MDDLDDLFGDSAPLQLSVPLSPGLVQRLNEASLNGCCQRLDWSKSGAIAYIGSSGYSVILQHLLCDPQDGQWKLSQEYVIDDAYTNQHQVELVHLSWDHGGNFLAIVDAHGRTSIYAAYFTINRMSVLRRCAFDPEDDLGAVAGLMWLYVDRPSFYYKPSIKTNGQWNFMCTPQKVAGPRHPLQRPSIVIVTKGGTIRVLYQDKDNRWQDIRADVQHLKDRSGLLSHVAMCTDGGDNADYMLLATHRTNGELRIHRLRIDLEKAAISIQRLKVLPDCTPTAAATTGLPSIAYEPTTIQTQLTTLEFIPAGPESKSRAPTQPFVLTAFSYFSHEFDGGDTANTILCKWELSSEMSPLHSSFAQLSSKKPNISSSAELSVGGILPFRAQIGSSSPLLPRLSIA